MKKTILTIIALFFIFSAFSQKSIWQLKRDSVVNAYLNKEIDFNLFLEMFK